MPERMAYIQDVPLGRYESIDLNKPIDVICDIDGTIADNSHRAHWLQGQPKNWAAYERGMERDKPIKHVITLVETLYSNGFNIFFLSGRGEQNRVVTMEWLARHVGFPARHLFMRKYKDYRADYIVKAELLEVVHANGFNPQLALDDRNQVVEGWRKLGLRTIQVNYGDF